MTQVPTLPRRAPGAWLPIGTPTRYVARAQVPALKMPDGEAFPDRGTRPDYETLGLLLTALRRWEPGHA